ncbi:MAG: hypothetical protein HY609_00680, partial [Deltaproteobacteria bacterium]|nr:hypothetical protein [Deltaproteobacteria bacterium]
MKARATTVILGLLLFLHFHCGGTSGDTFAPNGVSTGGAGLAQATNGSEVNTSKGVSIEGSVTVPTSSVANITIGTDAAQSVTISKNIVSDMPSDEGEICCKRYDGVVVANGGVDALGEIVGTV